MSGRMKNGLFQRGRIWWIQFRHAGKTVRESSGSTRKEDAKAMLDAKRTASRAGQLAPVTGKVLMGDLFALLAAHAASKHREPPRLKRLCAWFDVVLRKDDNGAVTYTGGWKAQAVDYGVLQRYVEVRQREDAADSTIHNELAAVRRAFRLGRKAKMVATVPDIPMPEVQNVRESFFTVPQLDRLLTLLPDYLRAPVQFASLTGMRRSNVFALPWSHVDFGRGMVRVPLGMTKSGEPITFPFAHGSEVERLLRAQEQLKAGPFVFHHAGRQIKSYHGAWRVAVKKLGDDGYGEQFDPKSGKTKRVLKRFHDLRHTFAQTMTDAGVAEAEILELGGWKTPAMLKRYRIVSDERKKAAAIQRDRHLQAEREKATKVLKLKQATA